MLAHSAEGNPSLPHPALTRRGVLLRRKDTVGGSGGSEQLAQQLCRKGLSGTRNGGIYAYGDHQKQRGFRWRAAEKGKWYDTSCVILAAKGKMADQPEI